MLTSVRRPRRVLLAAPLAIALAVAGTTAAANPSSLDNHQREVTVMTRNLYLGADLVPLVLATPSTVVGTVVGIVNTVTASQPATRMGWVADEIAANDPDFVGLQEVATWRIQPALSGSSTVTTYDFLQLLLDALAAKGEPYKVVAAHDNFDSAVQVPALNSLATYLDRDVILQRADDHGTNVVVHTGGATFTSQLTVSVLGTPLDFRRGYVWADVVSKGRQWRLVDTHPEAYPGFSDNHDYGKDQATELVTALSGLDKPVVVIGDLNSHPGETLRQTYAVLTTTGGFSDSWAVVHPSLPGLSCCWNETLSGGALYERIDFVLSRGAVTPEMETEVGVAPVAGSTAPMWPSDHAGFVATLTIDKG